MSDQWDEKAKEIRRSFIPFNVACPGLEEAIAIALRAAASVAAGHVRLPDGREMTYADFIMAAIEVCDRVKATTAAAAKENA